MKIHNDYFLLFTINIYNIFTKLVKTLKNPFAGELCESYTLVDSTKCVNSVKSTIDVKETPHSSWSLSKKKRDLPTPVKKIPSPNVAKTNRGRRRASAHTRLMAKANCNNNSPSQPYSGACYSGVCLLVSGVLGWLWWRFKELLAELHIALPWRCSMQNDTLAFLEWKKEREEEEFYKSTWPNDAHMSNEISWFLTREPVWMDPWARPDARAYLPPVQMEHDQAITGQHWRALLYSFENASLFWFYTRILGISNRLIDWINDWLLKRLAHFFGSWNSFRNHRRSHHFSVFTLAPRPEEWHPQLAWYNHNFAL